MTPGNKSSDDHLEAPLLSNIEDEASNGGYGTTTAVTATLTSDENDGDSLSTDPEVQDGVRQIEAVARTWSKTGLVVAYMRFVGFLPFLCHECMCQSKAVVGVVVLTCRLQVSS